MRRIVLFVPVLNGGGAERMLRHLGAEFAKRGYHCDLVVATDKGPPLEEAAAGVSVVHLHKRNSRSAIPAFASYLRRSEADVLMSTVFSANIAAIFAASLSRTNIRVVLREAARTDAQLATHRRWRRAIDLALRRLAYPRADFVVAVSEDLRSNLVDSGLVPAKNCCVIHNPITRPHRSGNSASRKAFPPEVVACGRLEHQKDYPTLLRAFATVLESRDARLTILGDGSLRENLKQLARELGISSLVRFVGFVDDPTPFLERSSVFVHTSTYEGFPSAILEAVLTGCQIVATDAPGGTREILQGGKLGALVPVGDYKAVATAILRLLSGEEEFSIPPTYGQRFSLEAVADEYLKVFFPRDPTDLRT